MERILLNDNWVFYREDTPESKETVRLPHANVTTPFNYFDDADYQFVSVYENTFTKTKEQEDKLLFLTFEGAAHRAEVYVNGTLVTTHQNGYTAFSCEVSKYSKLGKNDIKVVLDSRESLNVPPFGHVIDYMTYGGLYREAYIDVKDKNYIDDVFVKTISATSDKKVLEFEFDIKGELKDSTIEVAVMDGRKVVAKTDKTGALIVIPHHVSLRSIIETGDQIDAQISRRLIMNLFFKNSPLHDGAVIMSKDRIVAARCTLPITDKVDIPAHFGMRHKAAIGITEESDADVIVVSEETGRISFVKAGEVSPIDNINELKLLLGQSLTGLGSSI